MTNFRFRHAIGAIAIVSIWNTVAFGAVTITDVPYASRWDQNKGIVFGGVAGVTGSSQPSKKPTEFVNSCAYPKPGVKLYPCNDRGIHPDLHFVITFTAETDGYPGITYTRNGGTTAIEPIIQPIWTPKGSTVSFTTRWSKICDAVGASYGAGSVTPNCEVADPDIAPYATFNVGIYTDTPTQLVDSAQITIKIADLPPNDGDESTTAYCPDGEAAPNPGPCRFEVVPGDSKVAIRSLHVASSGTALDKYQLRVLWEEGTGPGAFANITSASAHADLDFIYDAAGSTNDLSNSRIDGFTNDVNYVFKVALIDEAGNVGYYTRSDADTACDFSPNPNCHEARPGEVVGVLADELNCFIATAAYGSALAPQVETFREFRNKVLLPNEWGRRFVQYYYEHSPKYARLIQENPILRASVRIALWPLLLYAWIAIKFGSVTAFMVLLIGGFSFALALWSFSKWIRSGRARV